MKGLIHRLKVGILKKVWWALCSQSSRMAIKRKLFDWRGYGVETDVKMWVSSSGNNNWTVSIEHLSSNPIAVVGGISRDCGFEEDFITQKKGLVVACDPTPKHSDFLRGKESEFDNRFVFEQIALAGKTGKDTFYASYDENGVIDYFFETDKIDSDQQGAELSPVEVECYTVGDLIKKHGFDKVDLLKIDIEGAEFDLLPDIVSGDTPIYQIAVEFHYRFYPDGGQRLRNVVQLLRKAGFKIAYRCPSCMDFLFVNTKVEIEP